MFSLICKWPVTRKMLPFDDVTMDIPFYKQIRLSLVWVMLSKLNATYPSSIFTHTHVSFIRQKLLIPWQCFGIRIFSINKGFMKQTFANINIDFRITRANIVWYMYITAKINEIVCTQAKSLTHSRHRSPIRCLYERAMGCVFLRFCFIQWSPDIQIALYVLCLQT